MIRASWTAFACRNDRCKLYRALCRSELAANRPCCRECGWVLIIARIICHHGRRNGRLA